MNKYVENPSAWTAPVIPEKIPQGDMPGDKIEIGEDHIKLLETMVVANDDDSTDS